MAFPPQGYVTLTWIDYKVDTLADAIGAYLAEGASFSNVDTAIVEYCVAHSGTLVFGPLTHTLARFKYDFTRDDKIYNVECAISIGEVYGYASVRYYTSACGDSSHISNLTDNVKVPGFQLPVNDHDVRSQVAFLLDKWQDTIVKFHE